MAMQSSEEKNKSLSEDKLFKALLGTLANSKNL